MYISWNWLKRHVDLDGVDPREMADRFTMSVAELEGIVEFGATYDKVVAARIVSCETHPEAPKLKVVEMDLGDRTVTAISGAPNTRTGITIPFALPGVVLEGTEDKRQVREADFKGIASGGMGCSERELGISDDHSGLLELPDDTPLGAPLTELLPVHDLVLEIDNKSITHRPDLWGHRGIAREVAALLDRPMLDFDLAIPEGPGDLLKVSVEAPDMCPRYTAQWFRNVTIGPSPLWLKLALSLVGVRPISNVVDITNFVMLDVANPTHAFDARFVEKNTIVVRRALEGEVLTTLDGEPRRLIPEDVVIADGARGVALGGVMGGENSEIQDDTTDVILEAACFDASTIRRTSSRLGLRTEASARFEKALDMLSPVQATALFSRLLREICPGVQAASRFYDVCAAEPEPTVVRVAAAFIQRKLGADVPVATMKKMLEGLEFVVAEEGDDFVITVPTFRATRDVGIPEDIVEEIGRLFGYDNITPEPIQATVAPPPRIQSRSMERKARREMVSCGYFEVLSHSFDSARLADNIGYSLADAVELENPISSDMPVLRRSLIPNLLLAAARNGLTRDDFRLFEAGRTFFAAPREGEIPHQERHIAGLCYSRSMDSFALYRLVKSHVDRLFGGLGRGRAAYAPLDADGGQPWVVADKAMTVMLGDRPCGMVGMLSPVVRDRMKLRGRLAFFELNLEGHFSGAEQVRKFKPLPRFPAIQNDLSVIVDLEIPFEAVRQAITEAGGALLDELDLFAIFRGEPIPDGKKSLSFHLRFRSPERTLTDDEVAPAIADILAALKTRVGGEIREV